MERTLLPHFEVSRETVEKLEAYQALVMRWTKKVNLIGRYDSALFWDRHILDCLQIVPLLANPSGGVIDLGSGAGLPGLVLAITTNCHMTLVEADHRKAAFLRAATIALDLRATIFAQRIEAAHPPPASIVTARALAPLPRLLPLAVPKLSAGGMCIFMKGQNAETELTLARNQWHMKVERFASRTSLDATIFRLSEIARADSDLVENADTENRGGRKSERRSGQDDNSH